MSMKNRVKSREKSIEFCSIDILAHLFVMGCNTQPVFTYLQDEVTQSVSSNLKLDRE